MNTRTLIYPALALLIAGAILFAAKPWRPAPEATPPTAAAAGTALVEVALPASLDPAARRGKTAFEASCAACHGVNAAGHDGKGPPLVHRIYEPSHHGDGAFLADADVADIVAYVRALQRENGIE